jgi:hypothetical protein
MNEECRDEGWLRAALDRELPIEDLQRLEQHVAHCAACAGRMAALRERVWATHQALAIPAPDAQRALARFHAQIGAAGQPSRISTIPRSSPMQAPTRSIRMRGWVAAAAALVAVLALLAIPPVRAAADQLLLSFRVQTVMFVPVTEERIAELQKLNLDGKSLFVAEPTELVKPSEPRAVASAAEASSAAGVQVAQPSADGLVQVGDITVRDGGTTEFQINIDTAREVLRLTGVDDVTLPDALGAQPIRVALPAMVETHYSQDSMQLTLVQGRSPDVTLPEGVDLAQLGRAALRVLGMSSEQADALSQQIDWSSTLLFPFPANVNTIRQVSINGAPGLVVSGSEQRAGSSQLYWQRGDHFFVMSIEGGRGDDQARQLIAAAESVR